MYNDNVLRAFHQNFNQQTGMGYGQRPTAPTMPTGFMGNEAMRGGHGTMPQGGLPMIRPPMMPMGMQQQMDPEMLARMQGGYGNVLQQFANMRRY
jgi:hypothetical protein